MSRYEKGHKAQTHRRVVDVASQRFRAEGMDGVGVASLMADAGLTHGGFYAHFASKEALIKEAVVLALGSSAIYGKTGGGGDAGEPLDLAAYVDFYLSPAHRDRPGSGCAAAALAPELARRPRATRNAVAKEINRLVARLATGLPAGLEPEDRQALAFSVFGQMIGTLQLARLASDRALSDRILAAGRAGGRSLAGLPASVAAPEATKPPERARKRRNAA